MDKINSTPETPNKEKKLQIPALGRKVWIIFLGLLLVLALVSTFAAFFQSPNRDPSKNPHFQVSTGSCNRLSRMQSCGCRPFHPI